jgi:hypothetical protein
MGYGAASSPRSGALVIDRVLTISTEYRICKVGFYKAADFTDRGPRHIEAMFICCEFLKDAQDLVGRKALKNLTDKTKVTLGQRIVDHIDAAEGDVAPLVHFVEMFDQDRHNVCSKIRASARRQLRSDSEIPTAEIDKALAGHSETLDFVVNCEEIGRGHTVIPSAHPGVEFILISPTSSAAKFRKNIGGTSATVQQTLNSMEKALCPTRR